MKTCIWYKKLHSLCIYGTSNSASSLNKRYNHMNKLHTLLKQDHKFYNLVLDIKFMTGTGS